MSRLTDQAFLRWLPALGVLILGAFVRFQNLATVPEFVFDEHYYVPQAYSLGKLGYEANWQPYTPQKAGGSFDPADLMQVAGHPFATTHGPVGKWLIWVGMSFFGPTDPVGWRFMPAVFGTLMIALVIVLGWLLLRSAAWATLAGLLVAVDNQAVAMSRVGMLDIFLAVFVLAGVLFVVLDRTWVRARPDRLVLRPWLAAAGAMFGLAAATKIVGAVFLVVFVLYAVIDGALAARKRGTGTWSCWWRSAVGAMWMLFASLVAYLVSWTGYLVSSGGAGRSWGADAGGLWMLLPQPVRALLHYQIIEFGSESMVSGAADQASPALSWVADLRPVLFYSSLEPDGSAARLITSLGDPIVWWSAALAVVGLVVMVLRRRPDWRALVVLGGLAAAWGPWLLVGFRTTFHYYAITMLPYLVLGLVLVLAALWDRVRATRYRRVYQWVFMTWLVLVVSVAALFMPESLSLPISRTYWGMLHWLPTWR